MRTELAHCVTTMLGFVNLLRVLRLRAAGVQVGRGVRIGRNLEISGAVVIADGVDIGADVAISGRVNIGPRSRIEKHVSLSGNIEIGEESTVGAFTFLSTGPEGKLKIKDDVYVNSFSVIGAAESVEIEDRCIFAAFVQITDAIHNFDDPSIPTKHAHHTHSPVRIEQNVWLGSGAMVTMGCTIGRDSVIGAKSLVTKDIPPLSVAYGIPAKVVRVRKRQEPGQR